MPAFHQGSYVVYIAGVEVPTQRVDIYLGNKSVPTANIVMAPDRELLRLGAEDRVPVAVFFLDDVYRKSPGDTAKYRLLFEGEIVGWEYNHQATGRSVSFRATGLVDIFSRLRLSLLTNQYDLATHTVRAPPEGVAVPIADRFYPGALFYQGLRKGDATALMRRPYDFIENVFQALFGSATFGTFYSSPGAHFFARWARRTNFINRWAPSPLIESDDLLVSGAGTFPILAAQQRSIGITALEQLLDQVSPDSIMAMLLSMFQRMYYEFTALPNMPLVTYDLAKGQVIGTPEYSSDELTTTGRGPKDPTRPLRLLNHVTKPELLFCAVPRCNIVFPSMVTDYNFAENYGAQITRLYVNDQSLKASINPKSDRFSELLRTGYPKEVREYLKVAKANPAYNHRNFLVFPEEYYRGPNIASIATPQWFAMMANALSAAVANASGTPGATEAELQAAKEAERTRTAALYDLHAAYEYMRERTSTRNGGVAMRFNPYLVPGFPAIILDREDTGVHTFCYIQNVTHSLSATGMQTTANYAFAQTLDEFFETWGQQQEGAAKDDVEPAAVTAAKSALLAAEDALTKIQSVTTAAGTPDLVAAQNAVTAAKEALAKATQIALESFYIGLQTAQMELQRAQLLNKDVAAALQKVADIKEALAKQQSILEKPDMAPAHPIPDIRVRFQSFQSAREYYRMLFYQNDDDGLDFVFDWRSALGATLDGGATSVDITLPLIKDAYLAPGGVTGSPATPLNFVLRGAYADYANNASLAISYVSRPICSLEEYIDFNGTYGVRDTDLEMPSGAKAYARILDLTSGPGIAPVPDQYGHPVAPLGFDTRQDWVSRLLNYREKVRARRVYRA